MTLTAFLFGLVHTTTKFLYATYIEKYFTSSIYKMKIL